MASDTIVLNNVLEGINFLKERILVIEEELCDISEYIHELRPEYLEKLKKIKAEGTISQKEFEKKFGVKL